MNQEEKTSNSRRKELQLKINPVRLEALPLEQKRGDNHYRSDDVCSWLPQELSETPVEQEKRRKQLEKYGEDMLSTYKYTLPNSQSGLKRMVESPATVTKPPTSPSNS